MEETEQFTGLKRIETPITPIPSAKRTLVQRGLEAIGLSQKRHGTIWKDANGYRHMLLITSNAYEDREGETIQQAALKDWVDKQWDGDTYLGDNPLLFWHDKRIEMGKIIFSDLSENFLVEIAKEIDGVVPDLLWDYAESYPEGGVSHGFWAWADEKDDSVFTHIEKEETSWLPREAAANAITYAGVLPMDRSKVFDKAVGVEGASAVLDEGMEAVVDFLKKRGVQSKAMKHTATDARAKLELVKTIGELAMNEGIMTDKKKASKFEDLLNKFAKMYGEEDKAEEVPDEEEVKEEDIEIEEEEVKELVIDDVRALMEEYLAPITDALAMLMEGKMAEEAAKSKSKQMPRIGKRASQDTATIVEIDLKGADVPQSIKDWSNPTDDFFGHKINRR